MAYKIMINEVQRKVIVQALRNLPQHQWQGWQDSEGNIDQDLEYLISCLDDLEVDEAADPGTLHGLCL